MAFGFHRAVRRVQPALQKPVGTEPDPPDPPKPLVVRAGGTTAVSSAWVLQVPPVCGAILRAAAVCLLAGGCVHRPFRPGATGIDPALCALGDAADAGGVPSGPEVKYMFCIPDNLMLRSEVARIDPSVSFVDGARSRRACGSQSVLCVGSTRQKGVKAVLDRLARQPYIETITLAPLDLY